MDDSFYNGAVKPHSKRYCGNYNTLGLLNESRMVSLRFFCVHAVKSSTSLNRDRSGVPIGCIYSFITELTSQKKVYMRTVIIRATKNDILVQHCA